MTTKSSRRAPIPLAAARIHGSLKAPKSPLFYVVRVVHGPSQVGPWSEPYVCQEKMLLYIGSIRSLFLRFCLPPDHRFVRSPFKSFPFTLGFLPPFHLFFAVRIMSFSIRTRSVIRLNSEPGRPVHAR